MFRIAPESPVPIWGQIVSQVTFAVAADDLPPGSLIPSVRDLARQLLVHHNTVAKAFQELERRGVLVARRGRGMEVTEAGPGICKGQRREHVRERLREVLREAIASRLPVDEVQLLLQQELQRARGIQSHGPRDRRQSGDQMVREQAGRR